MRTYPRYEMVCFLRPSNGSYGGGAGMLQEARHEVEQERITDSEYVLGVEVWGNETHGVHDYRGRRVNLTSGTDTIYWYRVAITERLAPVTDLQPPPSLRESSPPSESTRS